MNAYTEWLAYLVDPGVVIELRAPEVDFGNGFKATVSGFYDSDHLLEMAVEAVDLTEAAAGVYFTINPIDPELLALRSNRAEKRPRRTAKDEDVIRRTRLLVDLDPVRYSKTTGRPLTGDFSATAAEKARARATAERVQGDLEAAGWPEPVFIDSGNGFYLLYKVDLPTDDGGLVERCLKALAAQYDDAGATIDPRVFNPSRIMKVPGTTARKGDNTPDRPHRRSKVITLPRSFEAVPTELLEALGSQAPVSKPVGKYDPVVARSQQAAGTRSGSSVDRAHAYLKKLPPSVSGQGGHKALYKAAMVLADGFGFDHDTAMPLLRAYNERPDGDPESDHQLEHKLADALAKVEGAGGPSRDLLGPARDEETGGDGDNLADDPAGLNVPVNNPKRLAEVTLAQRFAHPEGNTLHHWGGAWWAWRDAAYALVEPDALEDVLTRVAEDEFERDLRDRRAAHHARAAVQAAEAQQGGGKPFLPEPSPQLLPVTRALVANVVGALRRTRDWKP